tara:strand:+ start:474 stop:1610 length:1137 start_codon:yes stop_codon:yes gene_type:complete
MSETPRPSIKIPSTPKVKDKNHVPEWHTQQELILKRWSEIGSSYRYLHDKSFKKFNTQNMWFALPVIVISTITGTANFAQGSFPEAWKEFVPLGIGFFNLSAGLITTVSQFLRVSELLEGHRAASLAYSKFARNISVELSLPVKERTEDGSTFIANCRVELDRLIEQSPDIPEDIIKSFVKRFPEPGLDSSGNPTNEYDFFRPEILDIRPIKIYRDNEAELKRKAQLAKIAAKKEAEEEAKKVKELLKQQELEREKIRKEFEKQQGKRDREVKKMLELAQKQTKAELIKNKFSITNIEESMGDLLGTLSKTAKAVSDYSDSDDDDDDDDQRINIVVTETPPETSPTSTQPSTPDILGLNTTNNDSSNNDLSNNDLNIV